MVVPFTDIRDTREGTGLDRVQEIVTWRCLSMCADGYMGSEAQEQGLG